MQFANLFGLSTWLFICIAKDITKDITAFNDAVKISDGKDTGLTKRFYDMAEIYTNAKQ